MSLGAHDHGMKKGLRAADVEALIREIQRYLIFVDAFRTRPPAPPAKPGSSNVRREGEENV